MLQATYRKIFDRLPEGVFVFDDKYRVKFTNAAFRRAFSAQARKGDTLAAALGCGEKGKCGESEACAYCAFFRVMKAAVQERTEQNETVSASVNNAGHTDTISVRIRVMPIDEKGKLFLGLTAGSYHSEMERELLSAQRIQQRLLPAGKSICGIPYSYMYIPCHGVGGDLPDVYELNGHAYGVLADVAGKGISAGMLSAFVKAGFDRKEPDLAKALRALNNKFNELNQDERSYITMAAVRLDREERKMHYVVAGHNAPILLKTEYGIDEIESPAPPISTWMPDYAYRENEMEFNHGDVLALVTDGVTECMNEKGEQFGIERTESVLMQSRTAEDFIGKLRQALGVFSGGKYTDDITAIAFDL